MPYVATIFGHEEDKTRLTLWKPKDWDHYWKTVKKEELPERKTEPFYPDFMEDVFAGVL
jgi:hypothetical protein